MILDVKKYMLNNIELSKNELKLILLLSNNIPISTKTCLKYLNYKTVTGLENTIRKINRKIDKITKQRKLIKKIKGYGYRILFDIYITY